MGSMPRAFKHDGQGAKQEHLKADEHGNQGKHEVHASCSKHDVEAKQKAKCCEVRQQRTPHDGPTPYPYVKPSTTYGERFEIGGGVGAGHETPLRLCREHLPFSNG